MCPLSHRFGLVADLPFQSRPLISRPDGEVTQAGWADSHPGLAGLVLPLFCAALSHLFRRFQSLPGRRQIIGRKRQLSIGRPSWPSPSRSLSAVAVVLSVVVLEIEPAISGKCRAVE